MRLLFCYLLLFGVVSATSAEDLATYKSLSGGGVTIGSYSANCVPRATSSTGLACGLLTDDGTNVTLSSGQFLAPAGTVSLPSISFSGDSNTGLYSYVDGNIAVTNNGVAQWLFGTASLAPFSTGTKSLGGTSARVAAGFFGGNTVTSSTPPIDITQAVNSGGTTFDIITADITNTASALINLLNLKVGGATKGSLSGTGAFQVASRITAGGATGAGNLALASDESAVKLCSNCVVGWSSSATSGGTNDISLTRSAAGVVGIRDGSTGGAAIGFVEQTAPAAPSADGARLYAKDNGAGKTQLCVLFSSGAEQCFATQP